MKAIACLTLLALLLLHAPTAAAQSQKTAHTLNLDKDSTSPAASINQIAWIAGHWNGEAFGGQIEEIWSAPAGGAMMGMFRLIQGDEVGFYELMTLLEEAGSLAFRLKHFNKDLTGWEEKDETVTMPLVALDENIAFFDGITFQRVDDKTLQVYLASENKTGGFDELTFTYKHK
ncbi:MAG: DUF6265 family protein [Bacteroidota bacterium]